MPYLFCLFFAFSMTGLFGLQGAVPLGLSLKNGVIMHEGKPIYTAGVNYIDAFTRTLQSSEDRSYEGGFEDLRSNEIRLARVALIPWWPYEFKLYFEDKAEFYRRLDAFVQSAEKNKIGLIFSFYFKSSAVPDMMQEPQNAYGDPKSRTIDFVRTFTKEVVERYRNSPAIWGWEFGNEMDLFVDLPEGNRGGDSVGPIFDKKNKNSWWCPAVRTEKDSLKTADMLHAMKVFAESVRALDSSRILLTGNARPREGAWHINHQGKWGKDSPEQYLEMLMLWNPEPYLITQHIYRQDEGVTFFDQVRADFRYAQKNKRGYYLGEWGWGLQIKDRLDEPENAEKTARMKLEVEEFLRVIEEEGMQISTMWVYDFSTKSVDSQWFSFTGKNRRSWVLEKLRDFNRNREKIK